MDPAFVDALNLLLILHADHGGQNCSTSAVRMVRLEQCQPLLEHLGRHPALWGTLHGGGPTKPASTCSK